MVWRCAHVVVLLNFLHGDCSSVSLQETITAGIDALLNTGDDASLAGIDALTSVGVPRRSDAEGRDERPVRKQRDLNRRLQLPQVSGDAQEPDASTLSAEPAPAPVSQEQVPAGPALDSAASPVHATDRLVTALDKETANYWKRQSAVEQERAGLVSDLDSANIQLNQEHEQLKREMLALHQKNATDHSVIQSMEIKHEEETAQLKQRIQKLKDEVEKTKTTMNLEGQELKGQIVTTQVLHDELLKNVGELTEKKMELEGQLAAGYKANQAASPQAPEDVEVSTLSWQRDTATAALVALSIVTVAAGCFYYKDKVVTSSLSS